MTANDERGEREPSSSRGERERERREEPQHNSRSPSRFSLEEEEEFVLVRGMKEDASRVFPQSTLISYVVELHEGVGEEVHGCEREEARVDAELRVTGTFEQNHEDDRERLDDHGLAHAPPQKGQQPRARFELAHRRVAQPRAQERRKPARRKLLETEISREIESHTSLSLSLSLFREKRPSRRALRGA